MPRTPNPNAPRKSPRKPPSERGRDPMRAKPAKARASRPTREPKAAPRAPRELRAATLLGWLKWLIVGVIWAAVAATAVIAWFALGLPDIGALTREARRPGIVLVAGDGGALASYGDLYGATVGIEDMPPDLINAVLAIEDRRFYAHSGFDPAAILRAVVADIRAGGFVQGGSTLTQQVAKNLFLTRERSLNRKIKEVLLALWLETRFTKDEILTIYLNRMYFGAGAYGVAAAAERFFGHDVATLTTYEAAVLAGVLQAPSRLNPIHDPQAAQARAIAVLAAMVETGALTPSQANAAPSATHEAARRAADSSRPGESRRYFADWVLSRVAGYAGVGAGDLIVETTLDPRLQALAERAVTEGLAAAGVRASERNIGQVALVAMTPDGAVRAMIGGRNYGESQFNRATQALRQPGSAFKPVVYLAALEAGFGPDTVVEDRPVEIDGWSPENFDRRYDGPMTLGEALARSRNAATVRLSERIGGGAVIALARRLGVLSALKPDPSLALGVHEMTLIELTAVYAAFANGGYAVSPYGIGSVRGRDGATLFARAPGAPGPRVVRARYIATLDELLRGVVAHGTGRAAGFSPGVAGKTGTSQNFRDAWFIGYVGGLVAGVWVGNDDGGPMRGVTGGGVPARIWRRFMEAALAGPSGGNTPGRERADSAHDTQVAPSSPPRRTVGRFAAP